MCLVIALLLQTNNKQSDRTPKAGYGTELDHIVPIAYSICPTTTKQYRREVGVLKRGLGIRQLVKKIDKLYCRNSRAYAVRLAQWRWKNHRVNCETQKKRTILGVVLALAILCVPFPSRVIGRRLTRCTHRLIALRRT